MDGAPARPAAVFPSMVVLDESASRLRCRMLSEPTHVLRRRACRLGKLIARVPGVLGVRETIDGVVIECAGDKRPIREAVRAIYSLIADGLAYPAAGGRHG